MEPTVIKLSDLVHVEELHNAPPEELLTVDNLHVGVYGTLRKGQGAHNLMEGLSYRSNALLNQRNFTMRCVGHGGFPCIISRDLLEDCDDLEDAYVSEFLSKHAPVIEMYSDATENILRRLDMYEGYPSLYQRRVYKSDEHNLHLVLYIWNSCSAMDCVDMEFVYMQDWVAHRDNIAAIKEKTRAYQRRLAPARDWLQPVDGPGGGGRIVGERIEHPQVGALWTARRAIRNTD